MINTIKRNRVIKDFTEILNNMVILGDQITYMYKQNHYCCIAEYHYGRQLFVIYSNWLNTLRDNCGLSDDLTDDLIIELLDKKFNKLKFPLYFM